MNPEFESLIDYALAVDRNPIDNPIVVIESPYRGVNSIETMSNIDYAEAALKDSLDRGESPMVSHLLYTDVLDDSDEEERLKGMEAGWQFYRVASKCVVYADRGISKGMQEGIEVATNAGLPVEFRHID